MMMMIMIIMSADEALNRQITCLTQQGILVTQHVLKTQSLFIAFVTAVMKMDNLTC